MLKFSFRQDQASRLTLKYKMQINIEEGSRLTVGKIGSEIKDSKRFLRSLIFNCANVRTSTLSSLKIQNG
mgnify:CR=1 FL=1